MRIVPLLLLPISVLCQKWAPFSDLPSDGPATTMVVGGRLLSATFSGPLVSNDTGATWIRSASGWTGLEAAVTAGAHGDTALMFSGGRFFRSPDRGDSWQNLSDGFVPRNTAYHAMAIGDTATLFSMGIGASSELWRRTDHSIWAKVEPVIDTTVPGWKRAEPRFLSNNRVVWTGKRFLMADDADGDYGLWRSDDGLVWTLSLAGANQTAVAVLSDTVWCLRGSKWLFSKDHGTSWDSLAASATGLWSLYAVDGGVFTRRVDTTLFCGRPGGSCNRLPFSADDYLFGAWSLGGRLVASTGSRQFLSTDSGRSWNPYRIAANNSVAYSLLRVDKKWLALTDGGVSSSSEPKTWSFEPGSDQLRDLRMVGGRVYGLGWSLHRRAPTGWVQDPVPASPAYTENRYWIDGDSATRWLTNGAGLWSSQGTSIQWTIHDTLPAVFGEMTAFERFGGRLWLARTAWFDPTPVVLMSYDLGRSTWDTVGVPHSVGVKAIGAGGARLWVGTDSGLFLTDDTGRTFARASLPEADRGLGVLALTVFGDPVAATFASQIWNPINSPTNRDALSFDGGKTWMESADESLVATSYLIDSTGILAGMIGQGLWKWNDGSGTGVVQRPGPLRDLRVVAGRGRLELVGERMSESVEVDLLDAKGRREEQFRFGPGTVSMPCVLPKGLHFARVSAPGGASQMPLLVP